MYAGAGVGGVWLLDLRGDQVQAFAEPATDGHGAIRHCRGGDRLRLPDHGEVTVRELLQLPAA